MKMNKLNKKGAGSLIAIILGTTILTTIVASGTAWYLSMNKNIGSMSDRLEAMTIAQTEWDKLSHMSLDELESKRTTLENPYQVGDYKVSVKLGTQGYFENGKCNASSSSNSKIPNCFSDTVLTIYNKNNERLYTTRTMPLASLFFENLDDKYAKSALKNGLTKEGIEFDSDTDEEGNLRLRAFVDGKEVLFGQKNSNVNISTEEKIYLDIVAELAFEDLPSWNGGVTSGFFTRTTGKVFVSTRKMYKTILHASYGDIILDSELEILDEGETTLGTTIETGGHQNKKCEDETVKYLEDNSSTFTSYALNNLPNAKLATSIRYQAGNSESTSCPSWGTSCTIPNYFLADVSKKDSAKK